MKNWTAALTFSVFILINTAYSREVAELADVPTDAKVAIIGAGAAGLYAAKTLNDHNVGFVVLEASDRIGGRLRKHDGFTDFSIDVGAEWIHGNKSLSYRLAKKHRVKLVEDEAEAGIWFKQEYYGIDGDDFPEEIVPVIEYLYEGSDVTSDETLRSWGLGQGLDTETLSFLDAAVNESGGSAANISIPQRLAEQERWSAGTGDFKIKSKSYYDLIHDSVAGSIQQHIVLNAPVTTIDYSGRQITIKAGNDTYRVDKVIVTVSINVLKSGLINFIPSLSDEKKEAIDQIGMEAGLKAFLKFTDDFFAEQSVLSGQVGPLYYDPGYGKSSKEYVLGAFVTGRNAQKLSDMGEKAAIDVLLEDLDQISEGQASASFTGEYIIQDWAKEPFVRGAYSYQKVGMNDARSILATPISDKVFFAGEATHLEGHYATVHGAMETGQREAEKVLRSF